MANISEYLNNIKNAIFGKDVRNSIHDGIEAINNEVISNTNLTNNTKIRQDLLEDKYDAQIAELANEEPQLPEIVDARSGFDTLGNVISKKTYHFNNVAEMKACNKLKNGDYVQTLGYYSASDGGSGTYQIVNDSTLVDDGGSVHDIINGLKAKLVVYDAVDVKQFGAKGDGITDDSLPIRRAIKNYNKVYVPKGTFLCMDINPNKTKSDIELFGTENSILKALPNTQRGTDFVAFGSLESYPSCNNIYVHDLIIDCDYEHNPDGSDADGIHALQFFCVDGVKVNNVKIINNIYIGLRGRTCSNVYVNDVNIDYSDVGIMFDSDYHTIRNINITNCNIQNGQKSEGVWVATLYPATDIYIDNITVKNKPTTAVIVGTSYQYETNLIHKNVTISNIYSDNCINTVMLYNTEVACVNNVKNASYGASNTNVNLRTVKIVNCKEVIVSNILSHASLNDIELNNIENGDFFNINAIFSDYRLSTNYFIIKASNMSKCRFKNIKGLSKPLYFSGQDIIIEDFETNGYCEINGTFKGKNIRSYIGDNSTEINAIKNENPVDINNVDFFAGNNTNPKTNTDFYQSITSDLTVSSFKIRIAYFRVTIFNAYTINRSIIKSSSGNIVWKNSDNVVLAPNSAKVFTFLKRNNTYYEI